MTISFIERLRPSFGFLIAISLSSPLVMLSLVPVSQTLALIAAILVPVGLIGLSIAAAPVIRVTESLSVARINVPLEALGKALVVPEDEVRSERGPKLSPASKFMIRGDIKHLVKVPVTDEADPTTYLLISTRRPEELASALNANRA